MQVTSHFAPPKDLFKKEVDPYFETRSSSAPGNGAPDENAGAGSRKKVKRYVSKERVQAMTQKYVDRFRVKQKIAEISE